MMSVLLSLLLTLRGSARSHAALRLEVLALRHQHDQIQGTICVIAYLGFVAANSLSGVYGLVSRRPSSLQNL